MFNKTDRNRVHSVIDDLFTQMESVQGDVGNITLATDNEQRIFARCTVKMILTATEPPRATTYDEPQFAVKQSKR